MYDSPTEQVAAVLARFAAAWKRLDGSAIAECFQADGRATVIGTDPGEYTVGMDAYRAGWAAGGYPVAARSFDWEEPPVIRIAGPGAWAHGVIVYDLTLASGDVSQGRMWITTALERSALDSGGSWQLAHLHASYA